MEPHPGSREVTVGDSVRFEETSRLAREVILLEAAMLEAMASRIDHSFASTVDVILQTEGRVAVTGLGKSGLVGRKIASTLACTGTPAFFVHSTEALHGDAGMLLPMDLLLAISNSGETQEVIEFARMVSAQGIRVVAMTGTAHSTLGRLADVVLDVQIEREADQFALVPTSSTTACMAMGDALCIALMWLRGFRIEDLAHNHPGGSIGSQLGGRSGDFPRAPERPGRTGGQDA